MSIFGSILSSACSVQDGASLESNWLRRCGWTWLMSLQVRISTMLVLIGFEKKMNFCYSHWGMHRELTIMRLSHRDLDPSTNLQDEERQSLLFPEQQRD